MDGGFSRRDVVLEYGWNSSLKRIDELHPSYDALQYPHIVWRGNDTYHLDLKRINSNKMSTLDYNSHQFMMRPGNEFIFKCGALLEQLAVDMYAKIEGERLRFIRLAQSKMRAEDYIHLRDAVANDVNADDIGHDILPSTFIGDPRHMMDYVSMDAPIFLSR